MRSVALSAADCSRDAPELNPTAPTPAEIASAVLVGAGDIGECGIPGSEATARLLDQITGTVFAAGDTAYYHGTREDFDRCYHPTWGRHRSRTRPVPGNHEYETPGAAGYFEYFGERASPATQGYYSFEVGGWHIVALNSSIAVDAGSPQVSWLRDDLAAHPVTCTLAIVHYPLFSSGPNGPTSQLRPIWDVLAAAGAEVVVSGHDHLYERFAPQTPSGRLDTARGIRQFVAGTGGAHLSTPRAPSPNSDVLMSEWGVLKFTLHGTGYSWEFIAADATVRDSGSGTCH